MRKQIYVLGCGPSGLLATHAAVLLGFEPVIYSVAVQSDLPGSMYLHRPIPDLTSEEPDGAVKFRKLGNRYGYAAKVYRDPHADCSWDKFEEGEHPAWSLRKAYDELWARYSGLVENRILGPHEMEDLVADSPTVISSIPARTLCRKPYHQFKFVNIWIQDWTCATEGEILYNGDWRDLWYRSSKIFGHEATEYGNIVDGAKGGIKPTSTDCDCWTQLPNFIRVGRFGNWSKQQLTHHAFETTYNALEAPHAMHRMQ